MPSHEERFSTTNTVEAAALWSEGFSHSHTTTEQNGRVVRFHFPNSGEDVWKASEAYRSHQLRVDPDEFAQGFRQLTRVAKALTEIAR